MSNQQQEDNLTDNTNNNTFTGQDTGNYIDTDTVASTDDHTIVTDNKTIRYAEKPNIEHFLIEADKFTLDSLDRSRFRGQDVNDYFSLVCQAHDGVSTDVRCCSACKKI